MVLIVSVPGHCIHYVNNSVSMKPFTVDQMLRDDLRNYH